MKNPITIHPDIQSGTPVFTGTRVPVKNLFDYLKAGDNMEEFLIDFPSVIREHTIAVLNYFENTLQFDIDEKAAA